LNKVTTKGQIVIPIALRRKCGLRKGARVRVYQGRIVVQPSTAKYVQARLDRLDGALRGVPLVQDLAADRARDKEREDAGKFRRVR